MKVASTLINVFVGGAVGAFVAYTTRERFAHLQERAKG